MKSSAANLPALLNTQSMKHRFLTRLVNCLAVFAIAISISKGAAVVDPKLLLVKAITLSTVSDTIAVGTPTYSLDLRLDTGGQPISGLQFYLIATPASLLSFGATPLTTLGDPFTANDVFSAPVAGAAANQNGATTVLFKASAGDYPAFANNAIVRFTFNTSQLAPGTYVFTPVGQELTNATSTVTRFASPQTFSLTVGIPEPASVVLIALGGCWLMSRRRWRRAREATDGALYDDRFGGGTHAAP